MRSLIVALLCLTLLVDTAKACWLRRQRGRSNSCRPVACCLPAVAQQPVAWQIPAIHLGAADVSCEMTIADCTVTDAAVPRPLDCPCDQPTSDDHVLLENAYDAPAITGDAEASEIEQPATAAIGPAIDSPSAQAPVVHGPTVLIDAPQAAAAAAPPAPEAASVLTPTPPQAMPATAGPAVVAAAAREPLPNLQPAGAPAANEQPLADAAATDPAPLQLPAATPSMPAPVESLAGGPEVKVATPALPPEPNLFDLFDEEEGEEGDAPAPSEPAAATEGATPPVMTDAAKVEESTAEPAEKPAAEPAAPAPQPAPAAPAPQPAPAEPAPQPAEEQPAAEPKDDTDAKPAADAAETAAAAGRFVAPNEPLRRWSDITGDHTAQGWLVELGADRVRILKVNGRHTTIGIESLSAEDRAYVTSVEERLAAEPQGTAAATTETAGL